MQNVIEMPKLVNIEVLKSGLVYKIKVNGVEFKRKSLTREQLNNHVADVCGYFGSDCKFVIKEAC